MRFALNKLFEPFRKERVSSSPFGGLKKVEMAQIKVM